MNARAAPVPVVVLSGFLGSGKSTLLNDYLAGREGHHTAVVVNEFGDVAIDHDLVRAGERDLMVTTTGCVCCTASSGIVASLFELHEATQRRSDLAFSRVIVETTGLADPAPIINQLAAARSSPMGQREHVVARRFGLAGFACVLDVTTAEETLQHHFECLKQLAFADRVVLTKTDLLDPAQRRATTEHVGRLAEQLNPSADFIDRHDPGFELSRFFAPRTYVIGQRGQDVETWLALDRVLAAEAARPDARAGIDRHAGRIQTFSLVEDQPISPERFADFLAVLRVVAGGHLLRMKGLVALAHDPARPFVAHAVQHVVHPPMQLDSWPSDDHRTRLVLITHKMDREIIQSLFDTVAVSRKRKRKSAQRSRS
jgi:G3E family GTPase